MAKPLKYPIKKVLSFDQNMIDDVDRWRAQQLPLPNQNEAIRRLIELGLEAAKKTAPEPIDTNLTSL